jgi:hypothetical protein
MPLNLASPGIVVREVDLTVGRVDPTSDKIGAIVAPFAQGPVELPTIVQNENDLLNTFGKPYAADKHYEHWLTASSFLAYGGSLRVVRADDTSMKNGMVGTKSSVKIKSREHYEQLRYDENTITNVTVAAKDPGSWGNGLRVGIIDAKADQVLGIVTSGVSVFSADITNRSATIATGTATTIGITTTSIAIGQEIRGNFIVSGTKVSGISTLSFITIDVATTNSEGGITVPLDFGTLSATSSALVVGAGITQSVTGRVAVGAGETSELDGYLKGIVTEIGIGAAGVKVLSHVSAAGTETVKDYTPGGIYAFSTSSTVAIHTEGTSTSYGSTEVTSTSDWFDAQTLVTGTAVVGGATTETTVSWNQIADRPSTTTYGDSRGARFDEVHVVVVDGDGKISGNAGTILEKHLGLSKAKDAEFSAGSPSYWRKYLKDNSSYIFGGSEPSGAVTTGYKSGGSGFDPVTDKDWDQNASGITFDGIGALNSKLSKGLDYGGATSIGTTGLNASISNLSSGYGLLENGDTYAVDFLLMGSARYDKEDAQALAQKVIAVANVRKDAVAFISPYRGAAITDDSTDTAVQIRSDADITTNVLSFYAPLTSTSYAVFDSGYKYMYDRFNDTFRYVPLNGDIAGTCARTDANAFPWFSPAGTERGAILNAVKLAYNPSKAQRDRLYSARVNPVIFSPGAGIVLFGDKTGLAKASAFDRINVRRLFIYLEDAIQAAARDQLFEFNDEITRTNFVNIVEPFLRDVQAKRGIQDYVVICDETNNTAAIIDNNEFVADIYIKPARSINFIGLTFVATRTGVSFEEVIGNV